MKKIIFGIFILWLAYKVAEAVGVYYAETWAWFAWLFHWSVVALLLFFVVFFIVEKIRRLV